MTKHFLNYLETLSLDTLVSLWNEFAVDELPDYYIWDNIEAYIELEDESTLEIAKMVYFGQIDDWEDKVYLDFFNNFISFNDLESSPINLEMLAEWLEEVNHTEFLTWQENNESEK